MNYNQIQTRQHVVQFVGKDRLFDKPKTGRILRVMPRMSEMYSTYIFAVISEEWLKYRTSETSANMRIYKLIYIQPDGQFKILFTSHKREKVLRKFFRTTRYLFSVLVFEELPIHLKS